MPPTPATASSAEQAQQTLIALAAALVCVWLSCLLVQQYWRAFTRVVRLAWRVYSALWLAQWLYYALWPYSPLFTVYTTAAWRALAPLAPQARMPDSAWAGWTPHRAPQEPEPEPLDASPISFAPGLALARARRWATQAWQLVAEPAAPPPPARASDDETT